MPRVYERSFSIRHYECDATGKVSDANYLRFMQEAAYSASADAGYDMVGYHTLGRLWFIRETKVTFVHPLRYGDRVMVRTWVEDFHRVRSVRAYEMHMAGTHDLVARAWSDWVFLDSETGMPSTIPEEMIASFVPDVNERVRLPRKRFPAAIHPGSGVFCQERRVDWRDLDPLGHVNNAVYCAYIQDCALAAGQSISLTMEQMTQNGVRPVSRELHIEYRHPARYKDLLEITTWITHHDANSITRFYTINRKDDGELLSQALLKQHWTDIETGSDALAPIEWLNKLRHEAQETIVDE